MKNNPILCIGHSLLNLIVSLLNLAIFFQKNITAISPKIPITKKEEGSQ